MYAVKGHQAKVSIGGEFYVECLHSVWKSNFKAYSRPTPAKLLQQLADADFPEEELQL